MVSIFHGSIALGIPFLSFSSCPSYCYEINLSYRMYLQPEVSQLENVNRMNGGASIFELLTWAVQNNTPPFLSPTHNHHLIPKRHPPYQRRCHTQPACFSIFLMLLSSATQEDERKEIEKWIKRGKKETEKRRKNRKEARSKGWKMREE